MKTVIKPVADLSLKEYRACSSLNMRYNGTMQDCLSMFKHSNTAQAVMEWDGDRLIGWALLMPTREVWHSTQYQRRKSKYVVHFYVRVSERCKGVGSRLMAEVKKMDSTPVVIPHDRRSADFFASYDNIVVDRDRRSMLTKAKKRKKQMS